MKTAIMIVTRLKDIEYLKLCLKSIDKFAEGFHEVVVCCPRRDEGAIRKLGHKIRIYAYIEPPEPLGHLHHQWIKCCADGICVGADVVMHVDSDCAFVAPVRPDDYLINGLPMLLVRPWEKAEAAVCWKEPTRRAVGDSVISGFETMCWLPAIHWASTYRKLRAVIENNHGTSTLNYILSCPTAPMGFSEFNALGQVALQPPNKAGYSVIDVSVSGWPPNKLVQFWSLRPPDQPQDFWHEGKLIEAVCPARWLAEKAGIT